MKVTVKFQSKCRRDLNRWFKSLHNRGTTLEYQIVILQEMKSRLLDTAGIFPDAVPIVGVVPRTYWWSFYSGWWIQFTIRDSRTMWFWKVRHITVTSILEAST
ncbi:hypothetical protein BH11PLA2_BH11PLA2_08530 [soil metagenome]